MSRLRLISRVSPTLARISYSTPSNVATWYQAIVTSAWVCAHCGDDMPSYSFAFCPPASRRATLGNLRLHPRCVDLLGGPDIEYRYLGVSASSVELWLGPASSTPMTRTECIRAARDHGARARFVRS